MRRLGVCVSLVLLLTMVAWLVQGFRERHEQEPVFKGKPLSSWLQAYDPVLRWRLPRERQVEADAAIRQIGTNAIPTLLKMLQLTEPVWKRELVKLVSKQHLVNVNHKDPAKSNYVAAQAFRVLGDEAKGAVPSLISIHQRNVSFMSQYYSTLSIGAIGPSARAAVPELVKSLSNADPSMREAIIGALGDIHTDPGLVVPALMVQLQDPRPITRQSAVRVLGTFGADAKPAIGQLIELERDPNDGVRNDASIALQRIDPNAPHRP